MKRTPLAIATIVAVGLLCRLPMLFAGVWRDEGSTYYDVVAPTLAATLREIKLVEITPPLYFLAMREWLAVAGVSDVSLKLPSLACGVALIIATYGVARSLGSRAAAIVAAGFAALSASAITLSTEARPYTLTAFLGALCTLAAYRYFATGSRRTLALWSLGAIPLTYVHYTACVLLGAFAVGALAFAREPLARRRLVAFYAANAGVALVFAPWLPYAAKVREAKFLEPGAHVSLWSRFVEQFGFVLPVDFMHVQYTYAFLVALALAPFFAGRRLPRDRDDALETRRIVATIALLAGTIVETALALHEQRYLLVFTPLAYGLLAPLCLAALAPAVAFVRGRQPRPEPVRTVFALLIAATLVAGIPAQFRFDAKLYGHERSGLRRLSGEGLTSDARTLIVVAPDYLGPALGYYLRERPGARLAGVPLWSGPEHSRCCGESWSSPALVDDYASRVRAASARVDRIAYIYDAAAVDEGDVPYSKTFALRARLMRDYPVLAERIYDGFKERVGLTLLRAPGAR